MQLLALLLPLSISKAVGDTTGREICTGELLWLQTIERLRRIINTHQNRFLEVSSSRIPLRNRHVSVLASHLLTSIVNFEGCGCWTLAEKSVLLSCEHFGRVATRASATGIWLTINPLQMLFHYTPLSISKAVSVTHLQRNLYWWVLNIVGACFESNR